LHCHRLARCLHGCKHLSRRRGHVETFNGHCAIWPAAGNGTATALAAGDSTLSRILTKPYRAKFATYYTPTAHFCSVHQTSTGPYLQHHSGSVICISLHCWRVHRLTLRCSLPAWSARSRSHATNMLSAYKLPAATASQAPKHTEQWQQAAVTQHCKCVPDHAELCSCDFLYRFCSLPCWLPYQLSQ